ncbi:MAG: ORF6N domain-containing protein [bacterium]
MDIVAFEKIESKILELRNQKVILDTDIAELYRVETRDINKAVKNNPGKFPDGYILELNRTEFEGLRWKFSTAKFSKIRVLPKAFSEKGLYMLATILKSQQAAQTTIAIIETFAKIRNLTRNIKAISNVHDESQKQNLLQKSGGIIAEILDDSLVSNENETTIELNFAVLKFKHTVRKRQKNGKK